MPKARKTALPRNRSAAAKALQDPRHRQRVIPDKRGKIERDQHRREMKHPHVKITRIITGKSEPCHFESGTDEYDCVNTTVRPMSRPGQVWMTTDPSKLGNTFCPKIGAAQWTCSASECICHLKERAAERERESMRYCPFCQKCHKDGGTCMGHHP